MRTETNRAEVLSRLPRAAVCAEIGVWKGDFSNQILCSTTPSCLHLIDPWQFEPLLPSRWYGGKKARSQAEMDTIHMGVVARFRHVPQIVIHRIRSVDAGKLFQDGHFDWVYVDGDHSYSAVMNDFDTWWPKIKRGGHLVGDDFKWKDEEGGASVKRAVADFCREVKSTFELVGRNQFIIPKLTTDDDH